MSALEQLSFRLNQLDLPESVKSTLPLFYSPEYLLNLLNLHQHPFIQELEIYSLCTFDLLEYDSAGTLKPPSRK